MKFPYTPIALGVLAALSHAVVSAGPADVLSPVDVVADAMPPAANVLFPEMGSPARESADLLRDLVGVSGSRKGGHGTDPSIRGLTETRLNILLDGAYVHGGCPSRMDPPTSYAPLNTYEQVTVIHGMQSLEYGSGGPGGTILFERFTDRFSAGEGVRGSVEAGYRGNSDSRELGADIAAGNAGGFARFIGTIGSTGNYEDGSGREVRTSFDARSGTLILGYTPDDDQRFEVSVERQETEDILFPGLGMDAPYADNTTARLKYVSEAGIGSFSDLKVEVYRSEVDHLMDNYTLRTPLPGSPQLTAPSTSDTTGGRIVAGMGSGLGQWKLGVDLQMNERDAERNTRAGALQSVIWPGAGIQQVGAFAELTHELSKGNRVIGGVRYDRVEASADQNLVNTDPNAAVTTNDIPANLYGKLYGATADDVTENNIGGLLRFEHDLSNDAGTVYAGISRTVRTADATERYIAAFSGMAPMVRVGNPDIDPEIHYQAEVGAQLTGERWKASVSAFVNKVDDYILRDRNAARNQIYRNIDATLVGGEANYTRQWDRNWSSTFGVAYVRADNDTDDRPIAQTPPLEGSVSLDYRASNMNAGARVRGAAKQTRVDLDSSSGVAGDGLDAQKTPAWAVLDLYGTYHVSDTVSIDIGMDNVFDRTYAQHMNLEDGDGNSVQVNEPGRTAWIKAGVYF